MNVFRLVLFGWSAVNTHNLDCSKLNKLCQNFAISTYQGIVACAALPRIFLESHSLRLDNGSIGG
ncbi:hypothetical protein Plhal304r1_c008g0033281 [Plasmopara halstedii]